MNKSVFPATVTIAQNWAFNGVCHCLHMKYTSNMLNILLKQIKHGCFWSGVCTVFMRSCISSGGGTVNRMLYLPNVLLFC